MSALPATTADHERRLAAVSFVTLPVPRPRLAEAAGPDPSGPATVDATTATGLGQPAAEPEAVNLAPLVAMLDLCTTEGLVELQRALAKTLMVPEPSPRERRVAELSLLTRLLDSELAFEVPEHPLAPVQVTREAYDAHRSAGVPSSRELVRAYGGGNANGWYWACRAAWGLLPDGRKTRPGAGFPYPLRGHRRPLRTTREGVVRSIRECAFALGRRPSSSTYVLWVRARRRHRRRVAGNSPPSAEQHIASIENAYRHFAGWGEALAAANVTDEELRAVRAGWAAPFGGPEPPDPAAVDALEALTHAELEALGITPAERNRLVRGGPRAIRRLAYPEAARLANALQGSLAWLAARSTTRRDATADAASETTVPTTYDGAALAERRTAAGIREDALLARAGITLGHYRRIVRGRAQPTLNEALKLEQALSPGRGPGAAL